LGKYLPKFRGTVLQQPTRTGCYEFVTVSGFKTAFPKHGKAMQWEVGVIKLTANRASALANKPQLRGKQTTLPDPLWDEGHYRIGFRRPSQDGRCRHFRPASEEPITQTAWSASRAKQKFCEATTIDWGSNPGNQS
jgi:hypothetical protein